MSDYKAKQRAAKMAAKRSKQGYPPKIEKSVDGSCLIATYSDGRRYSFIPEQKGKGYTMTNMKEIKNDD